jgi:DNA-binding response OmpR family regulator
MPDVDIPAAPRILLLDDDPGYCAQIAAYLEANGCTVRATGSATEFDRAFGDFSPDLVLLDQRLGETTGTEVLLRLRTRASTPCIVVTGQPDTTDRIVNLEVGADDEVEKTVTSRELLARIRAVLRRQGRGGPEAVSGTTDVEAADLFAPIGGGWSLSANRRELQKPDGGLVALTVAEFQVLKALRDAKGRVVPRAELCRNSNHRLGPPGLRSVDVLIHQLRRKFGADGATVIKVVRSVGYAFIGWPNDPAGETTH